MNAQMQDETDGVVQDLLVQAYGKGTFDALNEFWQQQ